MKDNDILLFQEKSSDLYQFSNSKNREAIALSQLKHISEYEDIEAESNNNFKIIEQHSKMNDPREEFGAWLQGEHENKWNSCYESNFKIKKINRINASKNTLKEMGVNLLLLEAKNRESRRAVSLVNKQKIPSTSKDKSVKQVFSNSTVDVAEEIHKRVLASPQDKQIPQINKGSPQLIPKQQLEKAQLQFVYQGDKYTPPLDVSNPSCSSLRNQHLIRGREYFRYWQQANQQQYLNSQSTLQQQGEVLVLFATQNDKLQSNLLSTMHFQKEGQQKQDKFEVKAQQFSSLNGISHNSNFHKPPSVPQNQQIKYPVSGCQIGGGGSQQNGSSDNRSVQNFVAMKKRQIQREREKIDKLNLNQQSTSFNALSPQLEINFTPKTPLESQQRKLTQKISSDSIINTPLLEGMKNKQKLEKEVLQRGELVEKSCEISKLPKSIVSFYNSGSLQKYNPPVLSESNKASHNNHLEVGLSFMSINNNKVTVSLDSAGNLNTTLGGGLSQMQVRAQSKKKMRSFTMISEATHAGEMYNFEASKRQLEENTNVVEQNKQNGQENSKEDDHNDKENKKPLHNFQEKKVENNNIDQKQQQSEYYLKHKDNLNRAPNLEVLILKQDNNTPSNTHTEFNSTSTKLTLFEQLKAKIENPENVQPKQIHKAGGQKKNSLLNQVHSMQQSLNKTFHSLASTITPTNSLQPLNIQKKSFCQDTHYVQAQLEKYHSPTLNSSFNFQPSNKENIDNNFLEGLLEGQQDAKFSKERISIEIKAQNKQQQTNTLPLVEALSNRIQREQTQLMRGILKERSKSTIREYKNRPVSNLQNIETSQSITHQLIETQLPQEQKRPSTSIHKTDKTTKNKVEQQQEVHRSNSSSRSKVIPLVPKQQQLRINQ